MLRCVNYISNSLYMWRNIQSDLCELKYYLILTLSFFLTVKEIQKVLTKLSKEKGMESIGHWRKACVRPFYWSVTSTQPKLQEVILAKFKTFQYHILNQHTNIQFRLFNKCAHAVVTTQRPWLTKGQFLW